MRRHLQQCKMLYICCCLKIKYHIMKHLGPVVEEVYYRVLCKSKLDNNLYFLMYTLNQHEDYIISPM